MIFQISFLDESFKWNIWYFHDIFQPNFIWLSSHTFKLIFRNRHFVSYWKKAFRKLWLQNNSNKWKRRHLFESFIYNRCLDHYESTWINFVNSETSGIIHLLGKWKTMVVKKGSISRCWLCQQKIALCFRKWRLLGTLINDWRVILFMKW